MRLGKRNPIHKPAVSLRNFLTLPKIPRSSKIPAYTYPMDGNDTIGDCVVAGYDHSRQIISGELTGQPLNFTEDEIIAFYKTQNPAYPNEDNGMVIQLFLEYLVNTKRILAFGKIDYTNLDELKAAIWLGLSVITGVQLQQAQMDTFPKTWDYKANSAPLGGHCIPLAGYSSSKLQAVSWGQIVPCTTTFIEHQMDEAWFILLPEHIQHPNFRNNFDLQGFSDAVYQITEGKVKVPTTPMYIFTKQLSIGSQNNDVLQLQKYLNTNGFTVAATGPGSTGNETNYYGKATAAAVGAFQIAKGICSSPSDAGYGQVGPMTRSVLNGGTQKTLLDAMISVESGGNDYAEGDKTLTDHAYGCLQIRQGVVDAVNEYLGTSHKAQECLGNRALSVLIFNTYWQIFPQFVTNEDKAKCWNGGPGWKARYGKPGYETYTKNLDNYWARVRYALSTP